MHEAKRNDSIPGQGRKLINHLLAHHASVTNPFDTHVVISLWLVVAYRLVSVKNESVLDKSSKHWGVYLKESVRDNYIKT